MPTTMTRTMRLIHLSGWRITAAPSTPPSTTASTARQPLTSGGETGKRRLPPQDLHRLPQRRTDGASGDRHADRCLGLADLRHARGLAHLGGDAGDLLRRPVAGAV